MKKKKRLLSLLLSLFFILSAVSPFTAVPVQAANSAGDMAVHYMDVGQGLSILVQSAGENLLYDGGDPEHSDYVISYLQQQNVHNIDYLISSHYDEDHLAGLIDCLNSFSVTTVIGSNYVQDTDLYTTFMNTVSAKGLTMTYPDVGDTFSFGTGNFTILSPDGISSEDNNRNSVVIKLENGSNHFIFTGDAEETSEQDMISTGMSLDCDVLCVGHHGSASSSTWDFLEATSPSYAVISCGTDNQYGHPSAETTDRLFSMGIPVFRTDKQGTVTALSNGSDISWNLPPCDDYSSGSDVSVEESIQEELNILPESTLPSVWLSATGEKYHSIPNCGRMNPNKARQISEADAIAQGYGKCSKCY